MATYIERYWTYIDDKPDTEEPPRSWQSVLIPWSHGWDFEPDDLPLPVAWALSDQCTGRFCIGNAGHRMVGYAGIETELEMYDRVQKPTHVLFAFSDPRAAVEFKMRFG